MSNKKIIENVVEYQKSFQYHPLQCGVDSDHKLLIPVLENNIVILKCPTCGYKRQNVPDIVKQFDKIRTDFFGCLI